MHRPAAPPTHPRSRHPALGSPMDMFTVVLAFPRPAGWLAPWSELLDQDQRITRPRQLYVGADARDYVGLDQR